MKLSDRGGVPPVVLFAGILAAAGMLFAAALIYRRPPSEIARPKAPRRSEPSTQVQPPPESAAPDYTVIRPVAAPTEVPKTQLIARAMDLSNVRSLVRALMEAAATENGNLMRSMIGAVGRYGPVARPVLQEELSRTADPRVREALNEALACAK